MTGFLRTRRHACGSVGIQCALCHSTVDDSFAPGIGRPPRRLAESRSERRRNRRARAELCSPFSQRCSASTTRRCAPCSTSWGPGKFDAELLLDGKAFRPGRQIRGDADPAGVRPRRRQPAHVHRLGLDVTYWNAFVANLEMHGQGTFFDPRLERRGAVPDRGAKPASATCARPRRSDHVEARRAAVLPARDSRADTAGRQLRRDGRRRGKDLFERAGQVRDLSRAAALHRARAGTCTRRGDRHRRASRPIARRIKRYRTTPLQGLFTHTKGGFYHDGRFATLDAVVEHYDKHFDLKLSAEQKRDLVEFLKSL